MAMTESDRSTMVGVFEDQARAEQAVNELRSAGFNDDQINLIVRSANVTATDFVTDEQKTEAEEETTATEMTPSTLRSKPEVTRTVVTVQAPGREQEALAILHRMGANNANVPDALEPELAPVLGIETDETSGKQQQVRSTPSTGDFFSGPGERETPPAP